VQSPSPPVGPSVPIQARYKALALHLQSLSLLLSFFRHLKLHSLHTLCLTPLSVTKSSRKDVVSSGHRLFLPAVHLHRHCHSYHEPRRPRRCRSVAPWRCLQRSELRQVLQPIRIARNLVSSSSNVQSGTATQSTAALSSKTAFRAICQ
jgi:hypothetical protein